jgi:predicted enzyme related to lactoylglutathione lyase
VISHCSTTAAASASPTSRRPRPGTGFGVAPYFDEPFYVGFNVGGFELGLNPDTKKIAPGARGVVAYWGVDDVKGVVDRLTRLGGTVLEAVNDVGEGIVVATVADPFGNPIGLIHNPHFKT